MESAEDERLVAAVNENTALLPLSNQHRRQEEEEEDVPISNSNTNNNGVVTVKSKTPKKESSFDDDQKSETSKKSVGDSKQDMNSGETADRSNSSVSAKSRRRR
jgi:hypothetical protein